MSSQARLESPSKSIVLQIHIHTLETNFAQLVVVLVRRRHLVLEEVDCLVRALLSVVVQLAVYLDNSRHHSSINRELGGSLEWEVGGVNGCGFHVWNRTNLLSVGLTGGLGVQPQVQGTPVKYEVLGKFIVFNSSCSCPNSMLHSRSVPIPFHSL